jgi:hypothetical protein
MMTNNNRTTPHHGSPEAVKRVQRILQSSQQAGATFTLDGRSLVVPGYEKVRDN